MVSDGTGEGLLLAEGILPAAPLRSEGSNNQQYPLNYQRITIAEKNLGETLGTPQPDSPSIQMIEVHRLSPVLRKEIPGFGKWRIP